MVLGLVSLFLFPAGRLLVELGLSKRFELFESQSQIIVFRLRLFVDDSG